MLFLGESRDLVGLSCILLIVAGIIGLRVSAGR
jgi:multidrug transporter EmrE-like cation transporter